MPNGTSSGRRRAAGIFTTILAIFTLIFVWEISRPGPDKYVTVIDSGSTGTRVYVYKWGMRGRSMPSLLALEPTMKEVLAHRKAAGFQRGAYRRIETEPGLDRAAGDLSAVRASLQPLLEWAKKTVPAQRHSSSPVFLFGTAGLRKLPEDDRLKLLNDINQVLESSPFSFRPEYVKVIDGADEGVYGWVGLNYIEGRLKASLGAAPSPLRHPVADAEKAAPYEQETVGALDLGGSSLEVTFIPSRWPRKRKVPVSVLRTPYSLYTHSFKGYGMNDAFDKAVTILLEAMLADRQQQQDTAAAAAAGRTAVPSGVPTLEHPCLQEGYSERFRRKDPAWHMQGSAPTKPTSEPLPSESIEEVLLVGRPRWSECRDLAEKVVDAGALCRRPPCALGAEAPPMHGRFLAMSGFFVVYDFFGLPLTATLAELEDAGRRYCGRPWQELSRDLADIKNIETYCFRAPYVSILLSDGLGLQQSQLSVVKGGFSWTLGAALTEGDTLAGLGSVEDDSLTQALSGAPGWMARSGARLTLAAALLLAWVAAICALLQQSGNPFCRGCCLGPLGDPMAAGAAAAKRQPLKGQPAEPPEMVSPWLLRGPGPELCIPVAPQPSRPLAPPPSQRSHSLHSEMSGMRAERGRRRRDRSSDCLAQLTDWSE